MLGLSQGFRECFDGTVCRNLIMFDPLGCSNETRILAVIVKILVGTLRLLLDQSFHSLALLALGVFSQRFEYLVQTAPMPFVLLQMFFESHAQFFRRGSFRHLG